MVDEPTIHGLLGQARSYVAEKKYLHAVQVYRKITVLAPRVEQAWIELAHVYLHLQRRDAAERALLDALDISRQPAQILFLLGSLHRESGNTYEALKYLRQLLDLEPSLPVSMKARLHYDLGLLYRERRNWRVSEYHLRMAQRLDPDYPHAGEALAELLLRRGAATEAIRFLHRALKAEPYSWEGHYLLGNALGRKGDWEHALEEYVASVEMDPDDARGWYMCGNTLLTLQRLEESEHYLRKALDLQPSLVDAMADLGVVRLRRGAFEEAQDLFRRVLQEQPGNRIARDGQRELNRLRKAQ